MAIPDYQTVMLPLLRLASDGREHRFRDAVDALAMEFNLSDQERAELLPSGSQAVFSNRVGWARTYLKQAGLLQSKKRGWFEVTEKGRQLLSQSPARIDGDVLARYPEFQEFRARRRPRQDSESDESAPLLPQDLPSGSTPEDALASY